MLLTAPKDLRRRLGSPDERGDVVFGATAIPIESWPDNQQFRLTDDPEQVELAIKAARNTSGYWSKELLCSDQHPILQWVTERLLMLMRLLGPILTAFDFDPKNVDVTSQPAEVSFSMSFSDVPSGVALAHVQAVSPNAIDTLFCLSQTPVSGDVFDGTWTCTMTIPQGVEPGAYRIIVQGGDALET